MHYSDIFMLRFPLLYGINFAFASYIVATISVNIVTAFMVAKDKLPYGSLGKKVAEVLTQPTDATNAPQRYGQTATAHNTSADGIITQPSKTVKQKTSRAAQTDSDGAELSEGQQAYFEDSLVRDADGRLLVVYHGSPKVFTEFSADFMSEHGSSEGQGFYFTDSEAMASGYEKQGGQLLRGYLNIKKPRKFISII